MTITAAGAAKEALERVKTRREQQQKAGSKPNGHAQTPPSPKPEPAPAQADHPPGLLGDLINHGERRCPFMTPAPALAGALAGLAAASGNQYVMHLGGDNFLALNIFVAVVGETGTGKETGFDYASLLGEIGGIRPQSFSSDIGLHQALATPTPDGSDPRLQLVLLDEWGRHLEQIKGEGGGHRRALMTKLMELRGRAIGGRLPAHRYAVAKFDLPEVRNPFINGLFATTPRTLHDALTSADVVDGSLNRILTVYIPDNTPPTPLDQIITGPPPDHLVDRLRKIAGFGAGLLPKMRVAPMDGERHQIGQQHFTLIKVDPAALAALNDFRNSALANRRADHELGALWARAFENATKIAGICALGEAAQTDPTGPLLVSHNTAAWAIRLVTKSIEAIVGDLHENLSEYEAERIQKLILRAAGKLRDAALAEPSPQVENTAPPAQQAEITMLKLAGFFPARDLVRRVAGKTRSSKDVGIEIKCLIDIDRILARTVKWTTARGTPEERLFLTRSQEP